MIDIFTHEKANIVVGTLLIIALYQIIQATTNEVIQILEWCLLFGIAAVVAGSIMVYLITLDVTT